MTIAPSRPDDHTCGTLFEPVGGCKACKASKVDRQDPGIAFPEHAIPREDAPAPKQDDGKVDRRG